MTKWLMFMMWCSIHSTQKCSHLHFFSLGNKESFGFLFYFLNRRSKSPCVSSFGFAYFNKEIFWFVFLSLSYLEHLLRWFSQFRDCFSIGPYTLSRMLVFIYLKGRVLEAIRLLSLPLFVHEGMHFAVHFSHVSCKRKALAEGPWTKKILSFPQHLTDLT